MDAMNARTIEQIEGRIENPSFYEVLRYNVRDQMMLSKDNMVMVNKYCYKQAAEKVENELLDVGAVTSQVREVKWLKEMLFSKSQLLELQDCYKKVINPFQYNENLSLKMTALERKMADFYIESESGEEELIGDEI